MKVRFAVFVILLLFAGRSAIPQQQSPSGAGPSDQGITSQQVGEFQQEVRVAYSAKDGLPSEDARSVAWAADGSVYVGTTRGLARFAAGQWTTVAAEGEPVEQVAVAGKAVWFISSGKLAKLHGESFTLPSAKVVQMVVGGKTFLATDEGLYLLDKKKFVLDSGLARLLGKETAVRQVALASDGRIAVAALAGLFLKSAGEDWHAVFPRNAKRSWAPYDVRGLGFDSQGRLWFASTQGVGCEDREWQLFTGTEGLPYNDFTTLAAGENGAVWFGTRMGAIRYDGKSWEYREGLRWLPHDEVRSVAVNSNGDAWFATPGGVSVIERRPMTLAAKARFFEDEIDKRHRRTPYEYITYAYLKRPGDKSEWTLHDTDNDGLWTAMYGAGECFAYAATHDPLAKQRAKKAFEALRFLRIVTQGGPHGAPPGFLARAILPTSGPDPNLEYTPERDEQLRAKDSLWKVIVPRWPVSADGKWYWKTDESSDELDGHFFFYALYYDLVAETEEERAAVREHVEAVAGHLVDHDFQMVDHDGKPTRWAIFNPENLNDNFDWHAERGSNSLSILNYLKVAEHITGDPRFAEAARELIKQHAYATNVLIRNWDTGPGSGNQYTYEMIFMNYYNLIRYETDPALRQLYTLGLYKQWQWQKLQLNPFFDFIFASGCIGKSIEDASGTRSLSPKDYPWLDESIDSLKRFSLDRANWRLLNSQRLDVVYLPDYIENPHNLWPRGCRRNGKVLPIDERWVERWSHDPWALDEGGDGRILADGTPFLLAYYMGLYHKYIRE